MTDWGQLVVVSAVRDPRNNKVIIPGGHVYHLKRDTVEFGRNCNPDEQTGDRQRVVVPAACEMISGLHFLLRKPLAGSVSQDDAHLHACAHRHEQGNEHARWAYTF